MEAFRIENARDFGHAVRSARKEAGLSQMQLAERCGCSQRLVSEIERGKQTAELEKALRLFVELGMPLTAGQDRARIDGRAEVNYAVVRIASELDRKQKKHRPLSDILKETHDE